MQKYFVSSAEKVVITASVLPRQLRDSRLILEKDGTCRAALFIDQGRLTGIEQAPADGSNFQPPDGWKAMHLSPDWLLVPSFVDCHVHFVVDGVNGFRQLRGPVEEEVVQKRMRDLFCSGVAAARDGSDRFNTGLQARQLGKKLAGPQYLPTVVATGRAIYRKGYYGSFLGQGGITQLEEAKEKLLQLKEDGADQVKVVLSGLISFSSYGDVGPVQFSLPELQTIKAWAAELGLPIMVHASSDKAVRLAARAGVHTVEHGYFVSEETLKLMAENNVAWVPTVAPVAAALKEGYLGGEAGAGIQINKEVIQQTVQQQLKSIKRAHDLGVVLGLGTDAGSPGVSWDSCLRQEMMLYHRAGLAVPDILHIASQNGALLLGLAAEMGTIAPGKKPHWLCVDKNILYGLEKFQNPLAMIF